MNVALWRIAVEAPSHSANDLTGYGASLSGGRWNSIGTPIIYCSTSIALATLESLSNLLVGSLPYNRFQVKINVPDALWAAREILSPLPGGWDALPMGRASAAAGDAWIASRRSALLCVPSIIVPDEFNVLINPSHPDVGALTATTVKRWIADPRFFR